MQAELFHKLEDAYAILQRNGLYKQVPLYIRGKYIYAGWAGGFVRLTQYGTSIPSLCVDGIDAGGNEFDHDKMGRLLMKKRYIK